MFTQTDELLAYIFDGRSHAITLPMAEWLASSRRFTAFVHTFRDKIRKKIRVTQNPEGILDLRLELETAHRLLLEKSLSLAYEPQQSEKVRSPDFAVSFTTSLTFMVEVTRLRANQKESMDERLADAVCSKLGQLSAGRSNILVIGVGTTLPGTNELQTMMFNLQGRAERNDQLLFQRHRFRDRSEFFSHHQRLSEILMRGSNLEEMEPLVVWVNPRAKHALPSRVRTVLYRSQIEYKS